jgi:hypothetical protein
MVIDSDEPDHIQQTTPSITTTNSSEKSNKGVQTGRSSRYSLEISKPKTPQAPKSPRLMPHRPMWDSQSTPTRPTPLRSKFRHRPHSRGRGRSHSPVNFEESSDKARKEESFSYRKRSPVGPAASQPVRIRKASGTKKDQFSYRRLTAVGLAATQPVTGSRRSPSTPPPLCRKHPKRELPVRKSTLSVHTYSDKKLFRNMVGTLSGPDYYGY